MNKREQIEHLSRLLHLEVHVVSTYDAALERLTAESGHGERSAMEELRGDHERHVLDITELVREMGEPTPPYSTDVEALVAPARDTLRAAKDGAGVLQGVRMIERVMAGTYAEARDWGVDVQVHDLLSRLDADEDEHLTHIDSLLGAFAGGRRER